ncbi:unnamed protein product [Ambrosiozyma monospora]|uniref:Unnamed protein product n=1 Tax=Ambrosiozyma monospora TaxID=43982 RepID=A0A9W6Z0S9_AMBMO|nr:unnamed protein product [Ambrosiozyma monospora]
MLQRDKKRAELEDKDEDVDDVFLKAINKDLESALKQQQRHTAYSISPSPGESEVIAMSSSQLLASQTQSQPQSQSQRQSEPMLSTAKSKKSEQQVIVINGKRTKLKHVSFQLNTTIFIPNFTPSKMTLSVKGSVLFNKLITKILKSTMTQADQDNPLYQAIIPKLVVYIHELNVIMSQYLKVGQLIGISDNGSNLELPLADDGGFEATITITTPEEADKLKNVKRVEQQSADLEEFIEDELSGKGLTLRLKDVSSGTNDFKGTSDSGIDIDIDADTEKEDSSITKVAIQGNDTVQNIIDVFVFKHKLPENLQIDLMFDGISLDPKLQVNHTELTDNCLIEVEYDIKELERLRKEQQQNGDDENTIDLDIDDEELLGLDGDSNGDGANGGSQRFTVLLKGKDGIPYKVQVSNETKVSALMKYYLQKANLDKKIKVKLSFDNEPLAPNSTIGDADMEEDDLIDVVLGKK